MPMVEQATLINQNDAQDFGWISAVTLKGYKIQDPGFVDRYDYFCRDCGVKLNAVLEPISPFFRRWVDHKHSLNCGYSRKTLNKIHGSRLGASKAVDLNHLPSVFRFIDDQREYVPGVKRAPTIPISERPTRSGRSSSVSTIATLAIYYRQVRYTKPAFDPVLSIKDCPGTTYLSCFKTIEQFRALPQEDVVHVYAGIVLRVWKEDCNFRIMLKGNCAPPGNESIQIVIPDTATPVHLLNYIMEVAKFEDPEITIFFYALGSFKKASRKNRNGVEKQIYEMSLTSSRLIYASKQRAKKTN